MDNTIVREYSKMEFLNGKVLKIGSLYSVGSLRDGQIKRIYAVDKKPNNVTMEVQFDGSKINYTIDKSSLLGLKRIKRSAS